MKKIFFLLIVAIRGSAFAYADTGFSLSMQSDQGDTIGQGNMYAFSSLSGDTLQANQRSSESISFSLQGHNGADWDLGFGGALSFKTGIYPVVKLLEESSGFNGMDISTSQQNCESVVGKFYVHEYTVDAVGTIQKAAIDFVQYCNGSSQALYGSLRYHSSLASACTATSCSAVKTIVGIVFSGSSQTDVATSETNTDLSGSQNDQTTPVSDELSNKIFRINAYSYDSVLDMYTLSQYGSAVLVGNKMLMTNAHVITDSDEKPTLYYEACETVSPDQAPKCFSALKLVKYDTDADLALLEIQNTTESLADPVTFGGDTLALGTHIKILGYPGNGGETITQTEGSIAGYEQGMYKTDANLDEGNSGGGAFDDAGNFIGVPEYLVQGKTSLGYVISLEKVQAFLSGSTKSINKTIGAGFKDYLQAKYLIQEKELISTPIFTTPTFTDLGFEMTSMQAKPTKGMYDYTLEDKDTNTLFVGVLRESAKAKINRIIDVEKASFQKIGTDVQVTVTPTAKTIGNQQWRILTAQNEDFYVQEYILAAPIGGTEIMMGMYLDQSDIDKKDSMQSWLEHIVFQKNIAKPKQSIGYSYVQLPTYKDIGVEKSIDDNGLNIYLLPNQEKFYITVQPIEITDISQVTSYVDSIKSMYSMLGGTVKVDNKGNRYGITITDKDGTQTVVSLDATKRGGKRVGVMAKSTATTPSDVKKILDIGKNLLIK